MDGQRGGEPATTSPKKVADGKHLQGPKYGGRRHPGASPVYIDSIIIDMLHFNDFDGYAAVFFIQVVVHFLGLCVQSQDGGAGVHVVPGLRCL